MLKYYLLIINIISFTIFGIDKYFSIKNKYRISEKTLFFLSIIGGTFGSLFGMYLFHHKTLKIKFKLFIPIITIIWIYILYKII